MPALTFREWEGREGDRSHLTRREDGTILLREAIVLKGARGERRQWHRRGDERWFGNYSEKRWKAFLEDIRKHGIREPVFIIVDPGKPPLVHEGNHRIQAAKQLGMREVPVAIKYFGHSERDGLVAPGTRRTKVATKSRAEKEDEQANALVRKAPKKKPPRRDLRKHRVDPEEDPDLKDDDKDLSMNYKDIGASLRVAHLWLATLRIAAKFAQEDSAQGGIGKDVKEQALKEYKSHQEDHPNSKMNLKDFVERVQERRKDRGDVGEDRGKGEEADAKAPLQKAQLQKAQDTVEVVALEIFEDSDLPEDFRQQVKETLSGLSNEETVEVVRQFEDTLRDFAANPPSSEKAVDMAKQLGSGETTPGNAGQQMAHALYTARVTLNPLRLGGKPISGEPKSSEELKARASEARQHFERLDSDARTDAVAKLTQKRDGLEPGSPEFDETVSILRGVGLAAFKNGEEISGLPSPSPQYTMLVQALSNHKKEDLLLGSVDDFAAPESQEVMRSAIADLTTEEMKQVAGEDEVLSPLIDALDMKDEDGNPVLSGERQEMLKQLIANVSVGEMSMVDPMIGDALRAKGQDASPEARKAILDKVKAEAAKEKNSGFLGAGLPDPAEMLAKARKGQDPFPPEKSSFFTRGSETGDVLNKATLSFMQHKMDALSKHLEVPDDSVAAIVAKDALQKGDWMETSKARIKPSPTPPVGSDEGKKASLLPFAYRFQTWPSF